MDRYAHLQVFSVILPIALFFSLVPARDALATSAGISGYSGAMGNCATNCHPNTTPATMATLTGAASVTPSSTNTYTLVVSGGPAVETGMGVSANGGTLSVTSAVTKMAGAEIVHNGPTALTGGTATYTFNWTAPTSNGTYTLYAAGFSSNNQGNTGGDGTATTTLMVSVTGVADPNAPPPPPPPAAAGPGQTLFDSMCAGCHSSGGEGGSITGESAQDILEAFEEEPVHDAVAAALSEADVEAIAAYLNGEEETPPGGGDTAAGQALFDSMCAGCHSDGGSGGPIFGESAQDILEAFEEEPVHDAVAAALSETDVEAIAAYLDTGDSGSEDSDSEDAESEEDLAGGGVGNTPQSGVSGKTAQRSSTGSLDLLALTVAGALAALRRRRRK